MRPRNRKTDPKILMNPSLAPDLLFTYGTLRRAAGNAAHRLLADSS